MTNPLFYWLFLALCSGYVFWKGGPPEKVAITISIVASIASTASAMQGATPFKDVETGMFLIDIATLLAFLALALCADRYWPIWITGIHLIGVATHAAKMVDPHVVSPVYAFTLGLWSYPILLLIVAGAVRHRKRLHRFGADSSWTSFSDLSGRRRHPPGRSG